MAKNDSSVVQKIKQNIFMATDVLSLELTFEKTTPKSINEEEFFDNCPDILNEIQTILTTGPTWEFNPTNNSVYSDSDSDKAFTIDKKKLTNYVREKSSLKLMELDINNNVAIVKMPIEILLANARMLSNEMIDKSSYHTVATLFGKINL